MHLFSKTCVLKCTADAAYKGRNSVTIETMLSINCTTNENHGNKMDRKDIELFPVLIWPVQNKMAIAVEVKGNLKMYVVKQITHRNHCLSIKLITAIRCDSFF